MDFRAKQTTNEKVARKLAGADTEATFHTVNEKAADEQYIKEKAAQFNQSVDDLQEKFAKHVDAVQAEGLKLADDLNNLEIMPLTSYVLISPFDVNPFQKIKKVGNIITDLGGLAPTYRNQENGKVEEETPYVKVGMVMEVGTDVKFVKPGDAVIYNIASEVAVPFFKFGFVVVAEQRIVAVVNEGLSARKEELIQK